MRMVERARTLSPQFWDLLRLHSASGTPSARPPAVHFAGHLLSILLRIRSAVVMAFAIVASTAGEGRPSQLARCRAARMLAAISSTRFRPSSTEPRTCDGCRRPTSRQGWREVLGWSIALDSPFIRREAACGQKRGVALLNPEIGACRRCESSTNRRSSGLGNCRSGQIEQSQRGRGPKRLRGTAKRFHEQWLQIWVATRIRAIWECASPA